MSKAWESAFEQPSSVYRGKPFWAWNSRLEEGELRRQIRTMKEMGLGGFFMHSRVGLDTPYLGQEWMDLVRACIDEAKTQKMEAWLYDEDRWPSGFAGGLVTRDRRYAGRRLRAEETSGRAPAAAPGEIARYAIRRKGDALLSYRRLSRGGQPEKGEQLLRFLLELIPANANFNGECYLDTLSHEAVRQFIRVTHDAYRRALGKDFGSAAVPGIFTDEPNYYVGELCLPSPKEICIPWTPRLPQVFRRRYGYDILDYLPEIPFELHGHPVRHPRWNYYDCITHLFVDAFARQIGEWCGKHGVQFTGHALEESTPRLQTRCVGSAMRFYEHMQAPGIDNLTENWYEYDTAKQCASVLRQNGRRWMLSELYGCTGWDFPFEGHKAVGDWQTALGVNIRCQHLYWYSMAGQAKRDYPASIAHHSPWWRLYDTVESYFARLGAVLSEGTPVRDLLVLHPIESTWVRFCAGRQGYEDTLALDDSLKHTRDALLNAQIDFDYGDEEMLSRLARVAGGRSGPRFVVDKASYAAVLVPPVQTIRATSLRLLERFAAAGGTVIFVGDPPAHVDAQPSDAARQLLELETVRRVAASPAAIARAAESTRRVRVTGPKGASAPSVLYMLRQIGDSQALFLCNTDRRKGYDALTVEVPAARSVEEWDPSTGRRFRADSSRRGDSVLVVTSLPPSGSRLFLLRPRASAKLASREKLETVRTKALAPRRWEARRSEPNVLVLDMPAWRIGTGGWQKPTEILRIDHACRESLGLPFRGGSMVQPWARKPNAHPPSTPLALRYAFTAETLPQGPVSLAIEQPGSYRSLRLNGLALSADAVAGEWVDHSLKTIPLAPSAFRLGENTLELEATFDESLDLEIVYLLGEFGVRVEKTSSTLVPLASTLKTGDWTRQGLPFYSGAVVYETKAKNPLRKGERLFLELPKWKGACVRVLVDDQEAGVFAWPPYELDLTPFVRGEEFRLSLELYSHRRNSHGPLHMGDNPLKGWIGPDQFLGDGNYWSDAYRLVPVGLLQAPVLSVRKKA